jgi:cysteine-rich repeat protein
MPRRLRHTLLALPLACGGADDQALDASTAPDTTDTSTGIDSDAPDTTADMSTGDAEAGHDASGGPGTTGTTAADSSTGTTTDTPPVCGDGQQDPGEECDDGNDDPMDGCKECARDRFIFASSVTYKGGELDGLYGADQRCRSLAAIAMLPNFATYRAWLSDSKLSAADRLEHHRGRYLLVNGLVVAMDWDDLTDGTLAHPITVTEFSETADASRSWTGTLASGLPALGSSFCFDWTDDASKWYLEEGGSGIRMQSDVLWSYYQQTGCDATAGLYCIEQ